MFAWGFKPQTAMCQLGVQNPKLTQTSKITNSKLTAFSNINKSVSLRFQKCPSRLALFLHLISIRNSRKVSGAIWGAKGIYTEGKPQPLAPQGNLFWVWIQSSELRVKPGIIPWSIWVGGLRLSKSGVVQLWTKTQRQLGKQELKTEGLFVCFKTILL